MILSLFDRTNKIRDEFRLNGFECYSVDMHPGHKRAKVDIVTDILQFNYQAYSNTQITFMFIALPCQAYSIASGGFHFKKNIPVTSTALTSIAILNKIAQITHYFKCPFIIENPSGGLINNSYFKNRFKLNVTRLTLSSFGFPTQKKTDLFFNFDMLLLHNPTVRCNNRYQSQKLDNLTYSKRVTYPDHFVKYIVSNIINTLKLSANYEQPSSN